MKEEHADMSETTRFQASVVEHFFCSCSQHFEIEPVVLTCTSISKLFTVFFLRLVEVLQPPSPMSDPEFPENPDNPKNPEAQKLSLNLSS